MSGQPPTDITQLLRDISLGDRQAEADLIPLVYQELRRIARRYMRREADGHTLQTTALVHEAYLRLARPGPGGFQNRAHFFGVAATVMRRILVDHARARRSDKRGGGAQRITAVLDTLQAFDGDADRLLALDSALDRLAHLDQRQSRIVELRFFAGMSIEETAEVMKISPRTVKRDWQMAKAWLYGELSA
jgi:RNA polymerase sigma factor (TIGR02999 family)